MELQSQRLLIPALEAGYDVRALHPVTKIWLAHFFLLGPCPSFSRRRRLCGSQVSYSSSLTTSTTFTQTSETDAHPTRTSCLNPYTGPKAQSRPAPSPLPNRHTGPLSALPDHIWPSSRPETSQRQCHSLSALQETSVTLPITHNSRQDKATSEAF